jgi:hypothetical protein
LDCHEPDGERQLGDRQPVHRLSDGCDRISAWPNLAPGASVMTKPSARVENLLTCFRLRIVASLVRNESGLGTSVDDGTGFWPDDSGFNNTETA